MGGRPRLAVPRDHGRKVTVLRARLKDGHHVAAPGQPQLSIERLRLTGSGLKCTRRQRSNLKPLERESVTRSNVGTALASDDPTRAGFSGMAAGR
jgi:hypothetical protein